ncbi:MAG: hypothetical protein Q8S03_14230 [Brevundimonas sp.]|uniref:hypothetical protein n=1 Tax=Brevundimonas sp. TaxID=1871086 RepID=UPI002733BC73|nr:hypothetical protein [Brevundimonas sp.]MDP3405848.1 hypothetical protein [Brevundimonas sp.]
MPLRRSLFALMIGCLVGLAGCARPFPERLNWYGEHPGLYTMAFRAAAEEAVVRSMTGLGYYEHMGDAAYTLVTTGVCTRATLETYLVRKERGCHLLGGLPAPDCLNVDACASAHYDPELFSDPEFRRIVTEALQRPCDHLTSPDQVKYWGAPARFGMSADDNWRILLCEGKQVFATSVEFDEPNAIVRIRFERGR